MSLVDVTLGDYVDMWREFVDKYFGVGVGNVVSRVVRLRVSTGSRQANMGNTTIFIAYKLGSQIGGNIVASTTKVGLAKLIGVSARAVGVGLRDRRLVDGPEDWPWVVGNVELVKVGGERGKTGYGGFRGMKGKDGLLASIAEK